MFLHFTRYDILNLFLTILIVSSRKAAFNGFAACTKRLIQLGAKADMRDEMGETALHKAAFNGHVDSCRVVLEQGVNVNCR